MEMCTSVYDFRFMLNQHDDTAFCHFYHFSSISQSINSRNLILIWKVGNGVNLGLSSKI